MPIMPTTAVDFDVSLSVEVEIPDGFLSPEQFNKELPRVMRTIGQLAHTYWESEAGKRLISSRRDYQKALSMELISPTEVQITLGGYSKVGKKNTYILGVELGGPPFDMKPGFLASPHTNKKKIPRAVADVLNRWEWKKPKQKWLVIPLHVQPRQVVFTSPKIFRTVHDNLPGQAYIHPGWKGVKIHKDVIDELNNNIIPDVLGTFLEEVF